MRPAVLAIIAVLLSVCLPGGRACEAFSLKNPQRTGGAVALGSSYRPAPTFGFGQLSLMALYDYEQIFAHRAPEPLRFKLEGNLGVAERSGPRLLMSANFFALYYLDVFRTATLRPYVEGGAGLVYSDFQAEDQGLRVNFNPQFGIGTEWHRADGRSYYGAVRGWHLSNGGLHKDNGGINALILQLGVLFD